MKLLSVATWDQAKQAFRDIADERNELMKEYGFRTRSEFLFRGHGSAAWTLRTTLDRAVSRPLSLSEYYRHVLKTRPQVEAFSDSQWELLDLPEYTKWAESISDLNWPDYPGYEYMIYLRHHGFPSPLLDWSMSPYVAAFFAFRTAFSDVDRVAIYCYLESLGGGKSWSSGEPLVTVRGPYARSHRRHFLQQCRYTVCASFRDGALFYETHDAAFARENPVQDLLWKIEIPASAAANALRDLDFMNVNALSLMGTEDALVETLSTREYRLG